MFVPVRFVEVDELMHSRMVNWSEWVLIRRAHGHCDSAEWQYKPERIADTDQRRKELTRDFLDSSDAVRIERAISSWTFPHQWRQVIKCHYVHRMPTGVCCRNFGVRRRDLGAHIGMVIRALKNRLVAYAEEA